MSRKLQNYLLIAFFIVGGLQPIYSLFKILNTGRLLDFSVYYMPAVRAALQGISIYQADKLGFVLNYPPTALLLLTPFTVFNQFWGQIIWTLTSLACLLLAFYFSQKSLGQKAFSSDILWLMPLMLLAFPVKYNFGMGQINTFVLFLMVLAFYWSERKKEWLVGLSLATAICLKVMPVLLVIYFLVKKKFKTVLITIASFIILNLITGLWFGFGLINEYYGIRSFRLLSGGGLDIYYNQAFSGLAARFFSDSSLQNLAINIFTLLVLSATAVMVIKYRRQTSLIYALLMIAILLANRFSWQHHFVWLVFPYLAVYKKIKKQRNWKLCAITAISYLLVAYNFKKRFLLNGNIFTPFLFSHVFFGCLLLWGIICFLIIEPGDKDKKRRKY